VSYVVKFLLLEVSDLVIWLVQEGRNGCLILVWCFEDFCTCNGTRVWTCSCLFLESGR